MKAITMGTYRPSQKLHPLSLLAQMSSRQANGCLQVFSGTTTWFIYLEQGKLIYASNSVDPFGRLDRHLRRLSTQIPSLVSAVRVQLRLLFETTLEGQFALSRDYHAICWLVEQQHINSDQAVLLIEELAKEVLESFLTVQTGSYELLDEDYFNEFPKFCQLDLRPLVEHCQNQLRRRQAAVQANSDTSGRSEITNRNGTYAPKSAIVTSPAEPPAPAKPSQPAPASSKTTYTIACIDDSPTVLQAINTFLDDKSFSVIMISDPVKALMQIIRSKPDLILLDVTMPNLDGYELCSLLRKHPSFRHTPIIMVTGNTGFIDRAKAKLVGSSGYLTKPFTQSDLIKIVFKHLS
jgi:two-component system, chemotaxis family, response regulator PixG